MADVYARSDTISSLVLQLSLLSGDYPANTMLVKRRSVFRAHNIKVEKELRGSALLEGASEHLDLPRERALPTGNGEEIQEENEPSGTKRRKEIPHRSPSL